MAKIIVEERTFTDRETKISTNYMYYAIKGGNGKKEYEVPLKMLTGAEKTALSMIADIEGTSGGSVTTKNGGEVNIDKKSDDDDDFFGSLED